MRLSSLELTNFRNYRSLHLEFGEEVQVIYGDNAQGKTNLLEAVYYLALLRTFRGGTSKDLMCFGESVTRIRGLTRGDAGTDELCVALTREGRKITLNSKEPPTVGDYLKTLSVVRFIPDDILLLKGPSEPRRKMLDRAIFHLQGGHLPALQSYNRALSQKNKLLKSQWFDRGHLSVWNEKLARLGAEVVARRLWYLDQINPLVSEFFGEISASEVVATVGYKTGLGSADTLPRDVQALEDVFAQVIEDKAAEERMRGFAVVGPHRDDLNLKIDAKVLKRFGSQGQHRMFALALKVAEIVLHASVRGSYPVLLLDDVRSELDEHRVRYLFTFLNRVPAQIFVTSTDFRELSDELKRPFQGLRVEAGKVTLSSLLKAV